MAKLDHRAKKGGTRLVAHVLASQACEPRRDALGAAACRRGRPASSMTRLLSVSANWPSRKNASRGVVAIQFGLPRPALSMAAGRLLRACLGKSDQLVLDLERAHMFVLTELTLSMTKPP